MDAEELEDFATGYNSKIYSKSLSEEDNEVLRLVRSQYKQLTGGELVFDNNIQIVS
jgi:hypothetical protein